MSLYAEGTPRRLVKVSMKDAGLEWDLLFGSKNLEEEGPEFCIWAKSIAPYTIGKDKRIDKKKQGSTLLESLTEEFVELNYEAILEHWEGIISDQEFLDQLIYIRHSSASRPSYTRNPHGKRIAQEEFLDIQKRIKEETGLDGDDPYQAVERYMDFYQTHLEANPNLLGLYLSYWIQRMNYRSLFDAPLVHGFALYLKTFHPRGSVAEFWVEHDDALSGDLGSAKDLAEQYWWGLFNSPPDYKRCEYFALLSIKDQDPDALLHYAVYLMDIRKDDPCSLRLSLMILLQTAITPETSKDELVVLQLIAILLCNRKLDLDCKSLLEAMVTFLKEGFQNSDQERVHELLSTIAGCYYFGNNVEKDILKAEELASMAFPDCKAVYYIGRIHHPNSSILDFGKPKLSKRAAKKKDDIQKIRFCDCQNVYEYLLALDYGKACHAENYEKMIRGNWMEKWRLKGPDINAEAQNQFKTLVQTWMKEKLC